MMEDNFPEITSVEMLPNFFLKVEYSDGTSECTPSILNQFIRPTYELPDWMWPDDNITVLRNEYFLINARKYNGNVASIINNRE